MNRIQLQASEGAAMAALEREIRIALKAGRARLAGRLTRAKESVQEAYKEERFRVEPRS